MLISSSKQVEDQNVGTVSKGRLVFSPPTFVPDVTEDFDSNQKDHQSGEQPSSEFDDERKKRFKKVVTVQTPDNRKKSVMANNEIDTESSARNM
jgi:hypothetical protein